VQPVKKVRREKDVAGMAFVGSVMSVGAAVEILFFRWTVAILVNPVGPGQTRRSGTLQRPSTCPRSSCEQLPADDAAVSAQLACDVRLAHMGQWQLRSEASGEVFALSKPCILVGRRRNCDIVLSLPTVSAHHCQLVMEDGHWSVRDLNSPLSSSVS
jgi:hypothetical protein